jgi:demethylmenaquinone methyltransferase/2-methoxy-6-polyprenyl-1,4-benzoquinol methylase
VLEPGARVVLLDNSKAQCDRLPIGYEDEDGNTFQDRTTDDGTVHRVLKNFPTESQLRALTADATEARFEALEHFWLFEYRR